MALDRWCRRAIEAVLLGMAVAAPWGLGGVHPAAALGLAAGTGLVLVLWAARCLAARRPVFRADGAAAALAGLTLLTALQLVPLPAAALRVLSPAALEANLRLRPAVGERLPDEPGPPARRAEAFPLSLSPPDTRDFFAQVFALTLLYAAARSNLDGPGPLRRLAWAAAVNGALLGFLAVAQRLSSPPTVVYWTVPTDNFVAGPFVNRNHLPFYLNVCLGLGCALLADRVRGGPVEALGRPSALWLGALVGATGAGVAVSHSRGGIVAALAAAAGCLAVWLRHRPRAGGLGWVLWAALAVAAAGSWVGWSAVAARLGTVGPDPGADSGRFELWASGLELFARHPAFGTGNGTFDLAEPGTRTRPGGEDLSAESAHNEYVEALAEGGVVRFGLTVLLVAWPIARLVRRHRRAGDGPDRGLLLGGLFGLLAVAAHSVVDFGVHLPAVAVLAAVLLAALMGAADGGPAPAGPAGRPRRALAAPAALALAGAAGLLAWDGLTAASAERTRWASHGLSTGATPTPAQADRAVRLMEATCRARPGSALYRHELGQAYLARALTRPPASAARAADLREALRHWRAARDLSPALAPTHARLGRYRDLFAEADPALAYFERARGLLPTDATMIYHCGQARWEAGDAAGACADWRASLALSDRHLADVLAAAGPRLGPAAVLRDVLPDRPEVILRAADALFPAAGPDAPGRRAYLERALALAAERPAKAAADWEVEARLEAALGRPDRAAAAYGRAVGLAPRETRWRAAYADALRAAGDLAGARRELETVVAQEPGNKAARDRLEVVIREIQLRDRR